MARADASPSCVPAALMWRLCRRIRFRRRYSARFGYLLDPGRESAAVDHGVARGGRARPTSLLWLRWRVREREGLAVLGDEEGPAISGDRGDDRSGFGAERDRGRVSVVHVDADDGLPSALATKAWSPTRSGRKDFRPVRLGRRRVPRRRPCGPCGGVPERCQDWASASARWARSGCCGRGSRDRVPRPRPRCGPGLLP